MISIYVASEPEEAQVLLRARKKGTQRTAESEMENISGH